MQGRFAFTSTGGGEYQVCFLSNATGRWMPGGSAGRRFRVDLSLEVGEMGIDYTEVAKKEHLNQLEIEVGWAPRRVARQCQGTAISALE